ncbi:hypothetical protein DFH08DRAFT_903360 [Mycena albidolilacea]|uniref:Uncharacterized protein n=1 Tax=Mycena albidolilacea TaxID=1033008 RepID=A0AAD7E953_9AGAR|nr:hypothetical protein DFH08DRAFT_903360 [Mycena albidolilacea]
MTSITPIPRPRLAPSRVKARPIIELMNDMPGWTKADFETFKKHVAAAAQSSGLDTYSGPEYQDPVKWKKLLNNCRKKFPRLEDFEGQWPLDMYYAKWTYWRFLKRGRGKKKAQNAGMQQDMNSKKRKVREGGEDDKENEEHPGSSSANRKQPELQHESVLRQHTSQDASSRVSQTQPRSIATSRNAGSQESRSDDRTSASTNTHKVSVRSSQSRHNHTNSDGSTQTRPEAGSSSSRNKDSLSVGPNSSSTPMGTTENPRASGSRSQNSLTGSQTSSSSFALSSSPAGPPPPCAQPAKQPNTRPQLAPCILCGYHSPVPAHETALLQKCFLHRAELLLPLAAAGVVADIHLRVLLRLRERYRKEFVHSLARMDKITYVEKADILDALETFLDTNPDVTSSPERVRKVQLASIPRPPKGVENVLAIHTCKYGYVKRHMQVADDEEYFELVDLVERQIPWYLDASVPIEEQDEEQLDTLITMICEEKPGLRKYDDLWPVYLHIRRFLSARAAGLGRPPRGNSTAPNAPPQHECPQLAKYPTSDVPASITALLEDYEMQELGPAFLSLGFNSDAAFTNNLTSQRKKDCIIEKLVERFPHCSQFQLLMLRYIVERV